MRMSAICMTSMLVSIGSAQPVFAQSAAGPVLAWQGTGRVLFNPAPPAGVVVGYLSHIRGIESSLFDGVPAEATAYFTARIDDAIPGTPVVNGDMSIQMFIPGHTVTWYLNEKPNQDFTAPETFSDGIPIATFRSTHAMQANFGTAGVDAFALNVMWDAYELTWSTDFAFQGKTYNLRRLFPRFSYSHLGSNTPLEVGLPAEYPLHFTYANSATTRARRPAPGNRP